MPEDLAIHDQKQFEQDELQPGGAVKKMVIVRFFLGVHGPFYSRREIGQPFSVTEDYIREKRRELEQLART